jgi:hypothetical protein
VRVCACPITARHLCGTRLSSYTAMGVWTSLAVSVSPPAAPDAPRGNDHYYHADAEITKTQKITDRVPTAPASNSSTMASMIEKNYSRT